MEITEPEVIPQLTTLKEFCKKLPEEIHEIYIFTRWGKLTDRCSIKRAVHLYGDKRVINFYDKTSEIREVYVDD